MNADKMICTYNEKPDSEYAAWVRAVRARAPSATSYPIPHYLLTKAAEVTWEMPTPEDVAARLCGE